MNKTRKRSYPKRYDLRVKYIRGKGESIRLVKIYRFFQGNRLNCGKRGGWILWGVFKREEWEKEKKNPKLFSLCSDSQDQRMEDDKC